MELQGKKVVVPASCYRRYRYFKFYLDSILSRLCKTVDEQKFWKCITRGKMGLEQLKTFHSGFSDKVILHVFCDMTRDISWDSWLTHAYVEQPEDRVQWVKEDKTIPEAIEEAAASTFSIMLFAISSKQIKLLDEATRELSREQKQRVFVSLEDNCFYPLSKLLAKESQCPFKCDCSDPHATSKEVCYMIQEYLETAIISFYDDVADFVHLLIPKERGVTETLSIKRLRSRLSVNTMGESVIKDLLPLNHSEAEVKDDRSLRETFIRNINHYLAKHLFFILCEEFSKHHGLTVPIVHSLLAEDGFKLERRLCTVSDQIRKEEWPVKTGIDGTSRISRQSVNYFMEVTKTLISDANSFLQTRRNDFDKMLKLEWELHGIIQQTKVHYRTYIPHIPPLEYDMQKELLSINNVESCGHLYGKLVISCSEALNPEEKSELRKILKEYQYPPSYSLKYTITPRLTKHILVINGLTFNGKRTRQGFV